MMKCYLLLIFSFLSLTLKAQNGTSITYEQNRIEGLSIDRKFRLVFNDTASFYYLLGFSDKKLKSNIFSKSLIHHAVYVDKRNNVSYNHVNYKMNCLIKDSLFFYDDWKEISTTKIILGYECKGALRVGSDNDSTLIWYNSSLGGGDNLHCYKFSLGLPLEIYDQKYNWHLLATNIEKGNYSFNLPKATIYTKEEFFKMREKEISNK